MVMTCLPTSAEVDDVLFGEGRVAEILRPGQIVADMTTGDPGETREMAARLAKKGSARSATTELALPKLLKGDFSVSFTLVLMHKDVRLAAKLGTDSATPMVLANVVRELYQTVINEQGADQDT
jgi:3-hydroxyisobutyrate dehydrogenase-like beta-hydroxyacid dehydrogenase